MHKKSFKIYHNYENINNYSEFHKYIIIFKKKQKYNKERLLTTLVQPS